MTFPVVEGRQTGSTTANATTHTITFPASIAAGELLLAFVGVDGSSTCDSSQGRWTKIAGQQKNGTTVTGAVFAKIAEASGSLDDLTVTTASEQASWVTFRISGHGGLPTGSWANGSSTNSDPPSHTPPYGAQDYLWIAARMGDAQVAATAAPTNFTDLNGVTHSQTAGASTHTAERSTNASSLDPGTFTSNSEQWAAATIAIPPASMVYPKLVASYQLEDATEGTGSLTTPSFTPAAGEVIVVKAATNDVTTTIGSTSGGSLSWTRQSSTTAGSFCYTVIDTATVGASPSSMTVEVPFAGDTGVYSIVVERWQQAKLDATPAVNGTKTGSGAPSATLTTEAANSVVTWINSDWNVVDPGAYVYRSATSVETGIGVIDTGSLGYTHYEAYQYAAAAGSQTIGLSAPAGQAWAMHGVEVQAFISTTVSAGNAAATGAANQPSISVIATAGHASATGEAFAGLPVVTPPAGNAAATGQAFDATVVTETNSVTAEAGHAAATGEAFVPATARTPDVAAATGEAFGATTAIVATAGNAAATGEANQSASSVTVNAGNAAATGAAFDPDGGLRLFLTATASAQATSPATGAWDDTTGDGKFVLGYAPAGASEELARSESDAAANYDVLLGTWVSPPVTKQGDIETGDAISLVWSRFADPSGSNLTGRMRVYVIDSSGTLQGSSLINSAGAVIFNETTPTAINTTGTVSTGRTVNVGERIVVELGFRQVAASGTTATGSIWAGGTGTELTAGSTTESEPGHITLPVAHLFEPRVTASAGHAAATGEAFDPTVQATVLATAGNAAATGEAFAASISTIDSAQAEHAAATGEAFDAVALATVYAVAGHAAATGQAFGPAVAVIATAGHAAATGAALDAEPTTATVTNVTAGHAAATLAANQPAVAVATNAGNAAGTGEAFAATVATTVTAAAGHASATGAAQQPACSIATNAGSGAGTAAANGATPAVTPVAGHASATGQAFDATAVTTVTATAGHAAASGQAFDATAATVVTGTAGNASGTGAANQPSVSVIAAAGHAAATGAANQPTIPGFAYTPAGHAAATGQAFDAAPSVAPTGVAGGDGAAYDATILVRSASSGAGWQQLARVLDQQRAEPGDPGVACPADGEPYRLDHATKRVCRFDGYRPDGRGEPLDGRDWGGLVAALVVSPGVEPQPTLNDRRAGWGP